MEVQFENKKKGRGFGVGVFIGVLITLFALVVVTIGVLTFRFISVDQAPTQNTPQATQQPVEDTLAVDKFVYNKLRAIEGVIDKYYYKEDLDKEALAEGTYRGLVDAIGDPYSVYYSEEELTELLRDTQGIYYGIGAYVAQDTETKYPKIQGTMPGTPAEAAGLRPNDIIFEVDGVSTFDMALEEATALIKGERGTTVTLTIVREGENDYLYIDVTRDEIKKITVESEMLDNGMAYIQIVEFDDITIAQFYEHLAEAKREGMEGLILDLRSNPGGSLNAVVEVAKMLLPEGLIVYTEDRYGNREEHSCDGHRELMTPMVVLIDGNSASASEILAGAIQDYGKGTLVGKTTYGKGIVQRIVSLSDGSAIKLTESTYFTPKGRNIHGLGVSPDIECDFDADKYYDEDYDTQLEKAKEVLADLMERDS